MISSMICSVISGIDHSLRLDQNKSELLRLHAMRGAFGSGPGAVLLQLLVLHTMQLPLSTLHCLPRDAARPCRVLSRLVLSLLPIFLATGVLLLLLHKVLWVMRTFPAMSTIQTNQVSGLSELLLLPRGFHAYHADFMRPVPRNSLLRMSLPEPRRLPPLLCKMSALLHSGEAQPGWGVALSVQDAG